MKEKKVVGRSRACARGMTDADGGKSSCRVVSDHARVRARARRRPFTEAEVAAMVAWLDREEIAKMRERRMRKNVRRLAPPQRKFALALKHVLEDVPGPQNLHGEKIMKRLKIGDRMYRKYISSVPKYLV